MLILCLESLLHAAFCISAPVVYNQNTEDKRLRCDTFIQIFVFILYKNKTDTEKHEISGKELYHIYVEFKQGASI